MLLQIEDQITGGIRMAKYCLGIDHGGTSTKAVLFTMDGQVVASASADTPLATPAPGHTERDMNTVWEMNCQVIRQCIRNAGIDPADIAAVSLSGHGKGLYLWGDKGPVRPGIVSTDTRAADIVSRWTKDGTADAAFKLSLQTVLPSQPVALMAYLKQHEPGVLERTRWVFGIKDYIRFRMTGEARGEITDLSGSSMVNLITGDYDDELLRLFGIPEVREKLPPLIFSTEIAGYVSAECAEQTGLCEGTPVAAGLFDIDACAVAMNAITPDYLAVIAGTWSINEYVAEAPVMDRSVKMNSLFCLPGRYLVEECSPTSASNLEWYIRMYMGEEAAQAKAQGVSVYDIANGMVKATPAKDADIVFLPYLYGGSDDPKARACFVGLGSHHTRAQILRSVYEGVVFCHKVHVERLLKHVKPKAIRLAGGAVNSDVWVQMFADALGLPIEIIAAKELGTLGAAMAAAVAAGEYADLDQAARAMVRVERVVMPDPQGAHELTAKYARYVKVSQALEGCWEDF